MSFMDKFAAKLEKFLMPIADVVSRQKHLQAIAHGFISTLPIIMSGSFAVLFNNVLLKSDSLFGKMLNGVGGYATSVQPILDKYVIEFMNTVWFGTIAISVLFYLFSMAYFLGKSYEVDGLSCGLVAVSSYIVTLPQTAMIGLPTEGDLATVFADVVAGGVTEIGAWGMVPITGIFGAGSIFAGMIVSLIATEIFRFLTQKKITIKLPEQVPPAVSKAFAGILPGMITISVFSIIGMFFLMKLETPLYVWINDTIQKPFMNVGQSPFVYIGLIFISQLFWLLGIHGMNVVGPILDSLYLPALRANLDAAKEGKEPIYNLVRNTVDIYGMHGGSGATLALLIAIFIFSKREEYRELAKLSVGCGVFQINEPVTFGLPIVLNPIFAIPFLVIPVVCTSIGYLATEIGFAQKIYVEQPWVTPPVFSAFTGTGGDWKAAVVALATFLLAIAIYIPFVIVANKTGGAADAE